MTKLRRTVPFLAPSATGGDGPVVLVDHVEAPPGAAANEPFVAKVTSALDLGPADRWAPAAEAADLVAGQYGACLELVYSHPLWARFRAGDGAGPLRAYLMENRHYLHAAPFRMASGVGGGLRPTRLVELQAEHVVEEFDHDRFFENGLAALGCERPAVRAARPLPVTVEWVHLMRTVSEWSPLSAALCSGLLESTNQVKDAVAGWHRMVVDHGLLPAGAADAIFEHVGVDLGLGHGENWRDALTAAGGAPAGVLADHLNAVTVVAEMLVRWLDMLAVTVGAEVVEHLPATPLVDGPDPVVARDVDGTPVWPAEVLDSVTHGPAHDSPAVRAVVGRAFTFDRRLAGGDPVNDRAIALASRLAWFPDVAAPPAAADLEKAVTAWMRTVDGHRLWQRMAAEPDHALVFGWLLENHHYIAAIWQHCAAAVAACPDPLVRAWFVHHLEEEFHHGRLLADGLTRAAACYPGFDLASVRPLPTTTAFVGLLRQLGQRDWKAYAIAVAFLQLTLRPDGAGRARHERFYERVAAAAPGTAGLLDAMRRHDAEDTDLGHESDTVELLRLLADRHDVGQDSLRAAALVPQMTWSFLDGIAGHYRGGAASVLARAGWRAGR